MAILPALTVLLIAIVIMLSFGLIVFARTYRKAYGWYFAATMVGIGGWAVGDLLLLLARDPQLVLFGAKLFYIFPMIIPVFIWFFAISFPENRSLSRIPPLVAGTSFLALSLGFLFNFTFFIKDIKVTDTLNEPILSLPGFLVYASFFSVFFLLTYAAFFLKIRRSRGMARTQVSYTLVGALLASIPALFTNLSLPVMGQGTLIWLGPLFTLIFAASVTIAIVKHRLFDIRIYAVRSAAYLLTLFVTTLLFVIPAALLSTYILDVRLNVGAIAVLTLVTLGVAFLFPVLKRFFDKVTKKWFYRDAYDPQTLIADLNRSLVANLDMEKLLYEAAQTINQYMKPEFALFGLKETAFLGQRVIGTPDKSLPAVEIAKVGNATSTCKDTVIVTDYLEAEHETLKKLLLKNNIAVLVRLAPEARLQKEGLGYLALGQKRSGNPYGPQDIKLLEIVSREMLLAIQNVLQFEEIEQFNITLQEKIEEATRKLRRTNDKLRQLDQTKDDFISMASHQLRTPLTSVKGYVSMVLDGDAGPVSPMQRKLLNQSFISSQRMVYLISDLLNVSRLRTGKFIIEPIQTNLSKVIEGEVEQLKETAKGRNLTLLYNKPEHFPVLMLDETKMRQVIMNFIDNAIYYTPSGGQITINLVERPRTIEFTVTDNGIGVPKHEQHHLFSKFFRAHNAKRSRPDGTGLGLFMAKKVIVAQGGALIFKSQEGKGSTFGFTFSKEKLDPKRVAEGSTQALSN